MATQADRNAAVRDVMQKEVDAQNALNAVFDEIAGQGTQPEISNKQGVWGQAEGAARMARQKLYMLLDPVD